VWALAQVDDFTHDGIRDVVIGDYYATTTGVHGLDATTGAAQWHAYGFGSLILRFDVLSDVNADGHPDVLVAHSGTTAKVLDGMNGNTVWSQPLVDKAWSIARATDISGDGVDDVFVGTLYTNNYCYFLNGSDGSVLHSFDFVEPVDAIAAIPDVVGDATSEMIAGGRYGYLACISGGPLPGAQQTFEMPLYAGWNLVTLPVSHTYTAKSLLAAVENGTIVYAYNASTGTPMVVTASSPPENDFPLRDGVGYFVAVSSNSTFNVTGMPITSVSIHIYAGWNMLGWYHDHDTTAKSVLENITDCTIVYWYDGENGTAKIVTPASPPENDFPVTQGMGLFVAANTESDWHGEG
jgi:hypothetical protein